MAAGPDPLAEAQRALAAGLAANADGRPAAASARFRAALRRLEALGDGGPTAGERSTQARRVRARALLGLVMSDFELRADIHEALAMLDEAERDAADARDAGTAVAVLGQRGLLWLRAGDAGRSLADHDAAVARLDLADPVDACCILLNRSTLLLERGEIGRAQADLVQCAERAETIGDGRLAFKARHNLGYAQFLAGDLPRALATMAAAAEDSEGGSEAIPLLDRAQVLLEAGLVTEADETLARAGRIFADQRLALDLAQVEISRSACAVLLRRPDEGRRWAQQARRRLARRGNLPWLARAELAELRAGLELALRDGAGPGVRLRLARRAADLADRTERAGGDRTSARQARLVRAAALASAGRSREARDALAAAGRLTGREPLTLALGWRAVAAQLDFDSGLAAAGRRQVAAGQALLAEHRRQFGSVEAVTAAAVIGERLAAVELRAALRAQDPRAVLEATERGRATFAGPARVRPPADPVLADLLAELRFAVERERALPPDAAAERATQREIVRLRAAARQRSWHLDGELGPPEAPTAEALIAGRAGTEGAVVDVVTLDGAVHAVVVDASGARLHHLAEADEVSRVARRIGADLHALSAAHLPVPMRQVVRGSLDRGLAWADATLLAPLGVDGPMHLAVGGELVTLPWGLLPSRRGLPTSVGTRLGVGAPPRRHAGAFVVAGPGLVDAAQEVEAVARIWGTEALTGTAATARATAAGLAGAGVVHLAAHGRHEPDNPLFSWLRLVDGPLFAHELEGIDLCGSVVVLSACEVGRATVRPGGEVLGLASVLLRLGADAVVAALAPLRDDVAAHLMPTVHRALRTGATASQALAAVDPGDPVPLACFATRP
ncbi:CHAT domain-containing protein [Isoptericola sp. b441]|uniref:CHAT domain-containing protein n=1 Tax=Actinotalea lenta TaxID=3064654 RepID=A0ABT9D4Y0_9CELL|nr:CHAT domain-containing protein [Isoptericola sp. b441]MDO8105738.1 CHAT domain-containing protein [Isoptericola sp. b441]